MDIITAGLLALSIAGANQEQIRYPNHGEANIQIGGANVNIGISPFASERFGVQITNVPEFHVPRPGGRGYDSYGGMQNR